MQRYSSKGSSSFREKEERAASLAAGLVLPQVSVKQDSSLVDRETMAAQNLAKPKSQLLCILHRHLHEIRLPHPLQLKVVVPTPGRCKQEHKV